MRRLVVGLLCLGLLFLPPGGAGLAQPALPLTVFAAASLTTALQEIDSLYAKRTGTQVRESFAASSTLARQIEAGAPVEIFISADEKWMDYLARRGLIARQRVLLGNALALIAPQGSAVGPHAIGPGLKLAEFLGPDGRLAVGDPDHVPAGIYAKEALQHLGEWDSIEPKLARAEDVRAALVMVERGDAPLGIVYVTDAYASDKVRIVGIFPAATHAPIVYPAAILSGADNPRTRAYFHFLEGAEARAIFARNGFAAP